jgi:hypothetical protein
MRTWSLLALCAFLAATIWLELEPGRFLMRPDTAPEPAANAKSVNPKASAPGTFAFAPLQQYSEIVDRTLFDASRRSPPEEPEDALGAAAAELRDLVLTGVVVTPDTKVAFFRDKTPTQAIRLETGGAFGKWVLTDIRAEGVTMRSGATTRELLLLDPDDPLRAKSASPAMLPQPAAAPVQQTISLPPVQPARVLPAPAAQAQGAAPSQRPLTSKERRAQRRRSAAAAAAAPAPSAPAEEE